MDRKAILAIAVVAVVVAAGCGQFVLTQNGGEEETQLPSKFSQVDKGIVTPVKYQNPWGTCWAFGATGAAETSILSMLGKTYAETNLDLSEKHLVWFGTHPTTSYDRQVGEGLHLVNESEEQHFNSGYNYGGDSGMILTFYAQGVGPVSENLEDYSQFEYKGKNSIDALDFYENGDIQDIYDKIDSDFMSQNEKGYSIEEFLDNTTKEEKEEFVKDYVEKGIFPEGTTVDDLDFDFIAEQLRDQKIQEYGKQNEYYEGDDWSLEDADRDLTYGYVLLNANVLPSTVKKADDGKYDGLETDSVKLMKYELYIGHGMFGAYNANSSNYNPDRGTYYSSTMGSNNHEIQIVGWDDSISRTSFGDGGEDIPEGDGAWLCKNSWGSSTDGWTVNGTKYYSDWGIKNDGGKGTGYFWLSYYDRSITDVCSLEFTDRISGKEGFGTYTYDYMPSYNGLKIVNSAKDIKTANVFTADDDEKLTAVNVRTVLPGSSVKVSVYALDDGYGTDATKGRLLTGFTKTYTLGGYHTVILDKPVDLKKGQKFSVVCEENNSNLDSGTHLLGLAAGISEAAARESGGNIYCEQVVNPGESLLYIDGAWKDLRTYINEKQKSDEEWKGFVYDNFSIKAFTLDVN